MTNFFSSCLPHSDEHSNSSLLESTFSNLLHTLFWTQYESKLLNRGFSIWTLMLRQQIFSIFAMDFGKTRCILIFNKILPLLSLSVLGNDTFLCLILGTFEYCKYVELVFSFGAFLLDSPWLIFFLYIIMLIVDFLCMVFIRITFMGFFLGGSFYLNIALDSLIALNFIHFFYFVT